MASAEEQRLAALRDLLAARDLEALLVAGPENRRYLSGFTAREEMFTESCGFLLVTARETHLLTDFRYREWAAGEAREFTVTVYQDNLGAALAELLQAAGIRRLGFESAYISFRNYERLVKQTAEAGWQGEWLPREGLVEELREVKTPEEVAAVRKALRLTEAVFTEVAAWLAPGLTERQVAWEIEKRLREGGSEGVAFAPIVAAGPNSARPHHQPTEKVLRPGEPIIIDMGARMEGYCADFTRTLILGEPPERFKEIYTLVRRAQARAEAGIRAGLNSLEADALARDLLTQAGYGEAFGHSLGHGVGLAVHEAPSLSPYQERATRLKAGSIFTVEPGIYLPGWGGVRLEDMVLLETEGAQVLTELGFYEWAD
ncbi:MAG: aminopeptidase P family protein [Deltaproteobacteria bacterium]|nr:aminopeptidase P family protein [Deltaproteobacteria bacterium]